MLALVTAMQFAEDLSDRQAADAVRGRIDWKYALGLELDDPGFHFPALSEFRGRLTAAGARRLLLDEMLEALQAARREQETEPWKAEYAVRAGVEGTLSQGVRGFGLRRCQYIGLAKVHLQHVDTAAAINVYGTGLAGWRPALGGRNVVPRRKGDEGG